MPTYYSPEGNAEMWDKKPAGYLTVEEWQAVQPAPPQPTLAQVRAVKNAQINRGFDAALAASLTMPSASVPPSAVEIALALDDFKAEDPEGWLFVRGTHTARRDTLLAAVESAATTEAVQAIVVSYAV